MHKVIKPFDFFHDGITPTRYEGICELPEDAAAVAEAEGWAEPTNEQPAVNTDTVDTAPESAETAEDAAAVAEAEEAAQPKKGKK